MYARVLLQYLDQLARRDKRVMKGNVHRIGGLVAAGVLSVLLMAGCVPSIKEVQRMRETDSPAAAARRQRRLLEHASTGPNAKKQSSQSRNPVWRVEAMRTMCGIDSRFAFSQAKPQLHAQLIALLKREYSDPGTTADRQRVRAWSVHCLAGMNDAMSAEWFVEVLEHNLWATDRERIVAAAAFDALQTRVDAIRSDASLRRRVLVQLAAISARPEQTAPRIRPAVAYLTLKLKDYLGVVDLVAGLSQTKTELKSLLVALDWNYQKLATNAHTAEAAGASAFKINKVQLLSLAWHANADVRKRSRIILGQFALEEFIDALAIRIKSPTAAAKPLNEDYLHFANISPPTSAPKAADPVRIKRMSQAISSMYDRLPHMSVGDRETILARRYSLDSQEVASHLLRMNPIMLTADTPRAMQHIRYLGVLRTNTNVNAAARRQVPPAIAAFTARNDSRIRAEVLSLLIASDPLELMTQCARAMKSIGGDSPAAAETLTRAYIAAIEKLESPPGVRNMPQAKGWKPHSYEYFAYAIARPEYKFAATTADFLASRDRDLLVRMLSKDADTRTAAGKRPGRARLILLGSTVQAGQGLLAKQTYASVVRVLRRGAVTEDEEQSMACVRYLLEFGEIISHAQASGLPKGAQVLVAMSAHRNTPAGQPNTGSK